MEDISPEEWQDIQTECEDLVEVYLEDNILQVSEVSFFPTLFRDIHNFMVLNGIQQGWWSEDDDEDELHEIVTAFCTEHLECIGVPLREHSSYRVYEYKVNEVKQTIDWLDNFPIQRQRTVEWYATRRQLFSASNLWKLFGTPSQYNSLIYEKCNEVKIVESQKFEGDILSPNARNWGIKYEPVSVLVYEHKYNTTINNKYGCIPHETYPIGASPDGINIEEDSPKYGHLLEIKNIYNREMDGIPSKEYWIQMQIQMETCRLEYCDFLETRFKEYSKEEYEEDLTSEYKGIMLFFIPRENTGVQLQSVTSQFIYVPLFVPDTGQWIDNKEFEMMESHILYIRTYWYLDEMFCTEIERNDLWFRSSVPKMIDGWETVLKERISGFEHRAPQSRKKKGNTFELSVNTSISIVKLDECGCELSL
jgi:hypothetical protein